MDMLEESPAEYNFFEIVTKTFIIHARQNQFIKNHIHKKALFSRFAIARKANSSILGPSTDISFWYQHFDLRPIRINKGR